MPNTLRKVSCCPANEASGRSSAVAEERTAKDASSAPPSRTSKARRIACSRSAGNGCASTMARISAPVWVSARTSSVSKSAKRALMRASRPAAAKKCRNAQAVVAKPVGTLIPVGNWEIISPRLAFLPPTSWTSLILRCSNGTTMAVGLKSADMKKLQKLKSVRQGQPALPTGCGRQCPGSACARASLGQFWAWWNLGGLRLIVGAAPDDNPPPSQPAARPKKPKWY